MFQFKQYQRRVMPSGSNVHTARPALRAMKHRLAMLLYQLLLGTWRSISWSFRSKWRLLCSAWLTGFFWIGQAVTAMADDGGPVVGPDLGSAGGQTVFEQYGPQHFALYLQLSDSNHGAPYVSQSMWNILRAIESAITYMIFLLARGAITSMEWLLNLNLYSDNSAQIDAAVRSVAAQVFWPLFGATLAIGAFSAYARMKREGGGTLFNDASWLVAASIFSVAFVTGPSLVMTDLDNLRTNLASAAMTGYSNFAPVNTSAAGFPPVNVPNDQAGATRKLADAMWNVYVVTPWCYVNFDSASECADLGKDYIQGNARWQHEVDWMCGTGDSCNNVGGNSDDTKPPYCPPELNGDCDWIRGQSFGRLGAVLFVALVDLPLVAMLLVLVLYGIMAILGFIMLLLLGVFFVLGWMIPGRLRQMGVRWFEEVLGALLQSVIITAVIGAVMVMDAILNLAIPKFGFFLVALLNLATFIVGFRIRGKLENITGIGSGTSSPFSNYMAMRAVGAVGRGVMRAGAGLGGAAFRSAPVLAGAGMGMGRAAGQAAGAAGHGAVVTGHAVGDRMRSTGNTLLYGEVLRRSRTASTAGEGGVATPYRGPTRPGGSSGPGRPVVEPVRRAELPAPSSNGGAASNDRRRHELPAGGTKSGSGIGAETNGDGSRRFVDGTEGMPRRIFVAGGDSGTTSVAGTQTAIGQSRPGRNGAGGLANPVVRTTPPARSNQSYSSPPSRAAVNERVSAQPTPTVPSAYTSIRRPEPPLRSAAETTARHGDSTPSSGSPASTSGSAGSNGSTGGRGSAPHRVTRDDPPARPQIRSDLQAQLTRRGELRMARASSIPARLKVRQDPNNYRRADRRRVESAQQEWDRRYGSTPSVDDQGGAR